MEPVFMMLSHSAAVAASLALDANTTVQDVGYDRLSALLRAEGQLLRWETASTSTNGIILDQGGPGTSFAGTWTAGANAGGWNGDYWHDQASGKGSKWVTYTPTLPTNGTYEVYLWWVENANRANNVPVDITHAAGVTRVLVNQQVSSAGWRKLLATNFNAGTSGNVTIRNDNTAAGTYVIADGVRFLPVGDIVVPPPPPVVEIVTADRFAEEFGSNVARVVFVRNGSTNDNLNLNYSVSGTAAPGADYAALNGTIVLRAGQLATNLLIRPVTDASAEGDETVIISLQPGSGYTRTSLTNSEVIIKDRPVDGWRKAKFSAAELLSPEVSGDLADPDGDGLVNLLEYAMGTSPKTAVASETLRAWVEQGHALLSYTSSKVASDVELSLQYSADLVSWSDSGYSTVSVLDEGEFRRITLRVMPELSPVQPAWLRFLVSRW
jgi:hypothetical protein